MLQKLIQYFKPFLQEGICIAFSGGADSSLLLKAACLAAERTAGTNAPASHPRILAVIAETRLHPHEDTLQARELALSMGAGCLVLHVDEFSDPAIMENPENRCYLCKRLLFSSIIKTASEHGCHHVFDGTNQNDTAEYRPGLAALSELGIHSPLKELGITKNEVRELSRQIGLQTSDKPSAPCLATRLPYGAHLDFALLDRIHQGEKALREMGFYNVRLRFHEPLLRVEVDTEYFDQILAQRQKILSLLKNLGFTYITLDLEGFRSGSMDIGLSLQQTK